MNRRTFLQNALLWSAGAGVQVPLFHIPVKFAVAQSQPEVAVVTGMDYEKLVHHLFTMLGGMEHFVKKGDTVVIKPNIGWDRNMEQAANTNPLVVRTMAELALAAGAERVKIFDRTCNEKRRCYVNSGMQQAIDDLGDSRVRLEHIDTRKFLELDIKKGKSLTRWEVYRDALEADCYINVPIAKHHGLSRLTLGLKNSMGVIGGNRGSLHFNLPQKLADLATVLRPTLTVVDATRILLRNGPQGGRLDDVKKIDTLIATTDPVAADAYATTLFGLRPDQIESTVAAYRMGLGEMDPAKMRIRTERL
ncbi:MAG: DUF362 domain-containing protein [Desulfopila sp.]|jgi:uncharacterized protein (DUF362 family)|nr:DUF362 domain-containing protein [Desulfopila sp.]